MKKFSKRIIIALCVLLSIAIVTLVGCSQSNGTALPPSNEQVETSEENNEQVDTSGQNKDEEQNKGEESKDEGNKDEESKDEQDISEENPADESKPSLPGGLVDGGEFSGSNT